MAPSILLISGSVRTRSVNSAVIATVADVAPTPFTTDVYGGLGELPHFNPDHDRDPLPESVVRLRAAIGNASALVFSTPEYAGAMPGALKNLLEWTVGGVEISDKPTGWINPSTNPAGAANTYASLTAVLGYTGARLVDGACRDIPVPRAAIGDDGLVRDQAIRDAIAATVCELARSIGS